MKAVETTGRIDKDGNLHLSKPLAARDKDVKLIVLFNDTEPEEDKRFLESISKNPAFSFLEDPAEDIYSIKDGEPFNG